MHFCQNNSQSCLAGLDSIIQHLNHDLSCSSPHTPIAPSSLDGIPYVQIRNTLKRDLSRRKSGRSPLAEKQVNSYVNETKSTQSAFIFCEDTLKDYHATPPAPAPFLPLPPVACSPSLLPSFLDFSFHTVTPSDRPFVFASPVNLPPVLPPQSTLLQPTSPTRKTSIDASIEIPSLSHPNSPYVPWDSPVRREFLRPLTPASYISAVSGYSRPYSRSGAQAPEPMDIPEAGSYRPGHRFLKKLNPWKSFQKLVKTNVEQTSRRITNLKKLFHRSARTRHPDTDPSRNDHPYQPHSQPSPSPLAASFDSSETTTLATWLAARQRESMGSDHNPPCHLTLDEYEQRGSWINLTGGPEVARDSNCEGCSRNSVIIHFQDHEPELPQFTENLDMHPCRSTPLTSNSFPLPSIHSVRRDVTSQPLSSTKSNSASLLARPETEESMPGSWPS